MNPPLYPSLWLFDTMRMIPISDHPPQQVMTSENFHKAYGTPLCQHTRHDIGADLFC